MKKVVLVTGEYAQRNYTVFDIIGLKGKRQLTKTLPFLVEEAEAVNPLRSFPANQVPGQVMDGGAALFGTQSAQRARVEGPQLAQRRVVHARAPAR